MKSERGQSMVEMAVSLVILLYLLSGVAEFGVLFFQYIQMRDSAQEGAIYGSIYPNLEQPIRERVLASSDKPLNLRGLYNTGDLDVTILAKDKAKNTKALNVACEGDALEVTVTYEHEIFMPFMDKLLNQEQLELNAVVEHTILSPACP